MADELYDEGFHVPYPCWLIVKKDCVARTAEGVVQFTKDPVWLLMKDDNGEDSVPVFTDDDTALGYCQAAGLVDEVEIIGSPNGQNLADTLQVINGMGKAAYVVFDPRTPKGRTQLVWPIGYAIERIRAGLGLK
jgi:hypothetical protein